MIYRQEKGLVGSRMNSTCHTAPRSYTPHLVLEFLVYSRVMVHLFASESLFHAVSLSRLNLHMLKMSIVYMHANAQGHPTRI